MQTCPGFFLKSLLESPGNLLEICSVKFVDTLVLSVSRCIVVACVISQTLSLVRRFLSTQVSVCGGALLPCSGGSEGPHSARTCWNCRSVLARHLVVQSHASGVADGNVQVPVGARDETFIFDGWWQWCCECWAEGIKRFVVVVVMYRINLQCCCCWCIYRVPCVFIFAHVIL